MKSPTQHLLVADFFGQPVGAGDQVAFMRMAGRDRREMTQGYVLKVHPKAGIIVRYGTRYPSRPFGETLVKLDFVKVPPEFLNPRLVPTP